MFLSLNADSLSLPEGLKNLLLCRVNVHDHESRSFIDELCKPSFSASPVHIPERHSSTSPVHVFERHSSTSSVHVFERHSSTSPVRIFGRHISTQIPCKVHCRVAGPELKCTRPQELSILCIRGSLSGNAQLLEFDGQTS